MDSTKTQVSILTRETDPRAQRIYLSLQMAILTRPRRRCCPCLPRALPLPLIQASFPQNPKTKDRLRFQD
ncbi:unnamed protein product [Cyprideis torosa]|uniref:Uncharacterized protein n=1 Tax=Cyprideis torosa TaxID=163714 RepID=A0A7R8WSE3_9CRUS|nr:unnamed protein product [Cyprideis torosa]CAG0908120.1 unnamed protein product [Cyprideis torosa]